jgi:hypothetical protein
MRSVGSIQGFENPRTKEFETLRVGRNTPEPAFARPGGLLNDLLRISFSLGRFVKPVHLAYNHRLKTVILGDCMDDVKMSRGVFADLAEEAKQVGKALLDDKRVKANAEKVAASLAALQSQLVEWSRLHQLLHNVVVALAPVRTLLVSFKKDGVDLAGRQAMLHSWRPCQRCVDDLAGFAEDVQHIGRPLRRDGRDLCGEAWVVDVVALQMLLEDALQEDNVSVGGLLDLAGALDDACQRHMTLADGELQLVVNNLQLLSTNLLGVGS